MLSRPWPVLLRHAPGRLFFQAYTKLSWPPSPAVLPYRAFSCTASP